LSMASTSTMSGSRRKEFTDEDREEFQEAFNLFDRDGDGLISRASLAQCFARSDRLQLRLRSRLS